MSLTSAVWCLGLCGFVLLSACGSGLPETTASGPPPRPPPRPGSSITHTRMCSCHACAESHCCEGAKQPEIASPEACKDSYDFSREGCGLDVASCTARCYDRVWRVRLEQDCDEKRPDGCC